MEYIFIPPKTKLSKKQWLKKSVAYDTAVKIEDILEDMCEKAYQWYSDKSDIVVNTDYDSFKNNFINMIYNKYI